MMPDHHTISAASKACSASVPGPGLCRNGFRQQASCHGIGFECPTCGKASDRAPMCMQEDVPAAHFPLWFHESGLPLFAQKGSLKHE